MAKRLAKETSRPLLSISIGDIGFDEAVGRKLATLAKLFRVAENWDAILLL